MKAVYIALFVSALANVCRAEENDVPKNELAFSLGAH